MILNVQSPVPLYHQLARIILDKIRKGDYAPGTKIPSEPELAKEYAVGRPTVRQATELLVRRRILIRKRGSGTYVCSKDEEIDLFSLAGTMSAFKKSSLLKKGKKLVRKTITHTRLIQIDEDKNNPFSGKKAYFFSRLSSRENYPFLIEDIYLESTLFSGIAGIDFSENSLSGIIEDRFGMRPTHGKQSFAVHYPDGKKALLLKITEQDPILFVRRYLHFREMENAIYSELYCRTDTFVFTQEIGGLIYD